MQRRRGLVSGPTPSSTIREGQASSASKRERSLSSSSEDSSASENEKIIPNTTNTDLKVNESSLEGRGSHDSHTHVDAVNGSGQPSRSKATGKGLKKTKRDMSDETRWQKMKVVGSEQEVMVDLTRVQKYVDYDSSTVQAFQSEVQSAKGNYRQQALADYSDL